MDTAVVWAVVLTVVLGTTAAGIRAARAVIGFMRRWDDVGDDWRGTPARPGVAARPGLMERVSAIEGQTCQIPRLAERVEAIEHEMHPNGGDSLRDQVDIVVREVTPGPTSQ